MGWVLIERQTLSSSVASVTLGSGGTIPQTYKTLKLLISARGDQSQLFQRIYLRLNSQSTGYDLRELLGTGAVTDSGATTNQTYYGTDRQPYATGATATASTFGNAEITIPNYTSSTNKPLSTDGVMENNGTTAYQGFDAGLSNLTSAVTSLLIAPSGGNWVSGSTFSLYGLK